MSYQDEFLELLLQAEVLRFGRFVTKSGRLSPYFFNTGHLDSGRKLGRAGDIYSRALIEGIFEDHVLANLTNLYGPAYKGIPLAVMVSDRLSKDLKRDISFTYNRKEVKDHGEGGNLVGHSYEEGDGVLVVEDVLTGGTSLRESLQLLKKIGVPVLGAIVGIDRQEKGLGELSAREELEKDFALPVRSILNIDQIISRLHGKKVREKIWIDDESMGLIHEYRSKYGR